MNKKIEFHAILGALLVVVLGLGAFFYVSFEFEPAPTVSAGSQEEPGEQPAGPADPSSLPASR